MKSLVPKLTFLWQFQHTKIRVPDGKGKINKTLNQKRNEQGEDNLDFNSQETSRKNAWKVGLNQSKRVLTKALAVGRKWRKDKSYLIDRDGGSRSRRTTPEKLDIW